MTTLSDDTLQRRIARMIGAAGAAKALNVESNSCLGTSLGSVRKENQDRAIIVWAEYAESPERNFTLAVLSDGMGGMTNGEEAATITISVFVSRVLRTSRMPPQDCLRNAAQLSNNSVYDRLGGRGGATLSAVLLGTNGSKFGVNVGDSRIYAATASRELVQISQDDTLAGVLGERHNSNENRNRLVQFIGMGEGIEPNILDVNRQDFETILLTSDGVHGASIGTLGQIVRKARSESDLTRKFLSLSEILGGQDNGTVIALGRPERKQASDSDQGLSLTFLTVSERLEIWIPVLGEDSKHERSRPVSIERTEPEFLPNNNSAPSNSPPSKDVDLPKKKRKSQPRVSRSIKGNRTEQQGLLLEDEKPTPVLDIKFPPSE